ncbi:MAG TPA: hypothetical protein DIU15_04310 [Deltaproteobacteria bacterium]|nr:hypothetical protein [Deltaproteobacteria bacterium]HCP45237.1 hypothetical protein [Deltaproteobacteria bacterium]
MMQTARYLFVCTANINRSPAAAMWTRQHFANRFVNCDIRSAGTHGIDGLRAGPDMVLAMGQLGVDLRDHRTSALTSEAISWADHIVVMEPAHAQIVLALHEGARGQLIPLWRYLDETNDHVVDPQGGPLEGFHKCAEELRRATAMLVDEHLAARRQQQST